MVVAPPMAVLAAVLAWFGLVASPASAAIPTVGLGTAASFAVLAGTTVTNTGPSVISGDLGVSPGSAVTGFPPGVVINGTQHVADAVALQAQADLTAACNDAAGRTPATAIPADIGGQILVSGVYNNATSIGLTGTVTLDAQGDPNAVFIFQAGSTLITAPNSTVSLINGAQPCNVFWQVGSSATLDTNTTFVGSVMALTSVSVLTGTTVAGRILARNGQVSLDTNTITQTDCAAPTPTPTVTPTVTPTTPAPTSTTRPGPFHHGKGGRPGTGGGVIPGGHPETGGGGASLAYDANLIAVGGAALAGAAAAASLAIRRRRDRRCWVRRPPARTLDPDIRWPARYP